jgi:hypothetical protein
VAAPLRAGVRGDAEQLWHAGGPALAPELLDDLAARFIRAGWSLKWLHREILLSSAYGQVSQASPKGRAADPDNRLLGRMNRRRLEVEPWRDAILSAAGTLDRRLGGAPMELGTPENVRRTLYGTVTRRDLNDLLRLYDFPDPMAHSPARFHTTTPLQGLFVLNSPFIGKQATALAARVKAEAPGFVSAQVRRAHLLLYGRAPAARELEAAVAFLGAQPSDELWGQYLEVLLARNELMFID